jgi:hypothetical protein
MRNPVLLEDEPEVAAVKPIAFREYSAQKTKKQHWEAQMRGWLVTGIGAAWLAALACLPMAAPRAPPELSLSRASAAFLLACWLQVCRCHCNGPTSAPHTVLWFEASRESQNRIVCTYMATTENRLAFSNTHYSNVIRPPKDALRDTLHQTPLQAPCIIFFR